MSRIPGGALCLAAVMMFATAGARTASAQPAPYDHMHFTVADAAAASAWYIEHMGGTKGTAANEVMFGPVRFLFREAAGAEKSEGSVIDHIGFSVRDIDATIAQLQKAGVKVVSPVRDIPKLFKIAFVEDPWGTKIELAQDTAVLGFHHIHLRGPDPERLLAWVADSFAGERGKFKGMMDGVQFGTLWVLASKSNEPVAPSTGHSVDHLGWGAGNLAQTATALKAKNVKFTMEPREFGAIRIAFVEGPDGLRVELVQR